MSIASVGGQPLYSPFAPPATGVAVKSESSVDPARVPATPPPGESNSTGVKNKSPETRPDSIREAPDRKERSRGGDAAEGEIAAREPAAADENESVSSPKECQTCKNRLYVDGSNDPTVSFQAPTRISPDAAYGAVRAHEQQHVVHEAVNAEQSGRKVVMQSVVLHMAICPECGRTYVSGGTTTTVTKPDSNQQGIGGQRAEDVGRVFDVRV